MKRIIFLAALLWAWGAASSQATDVFDPATNTLSIPSLQIGTSNYENARLLLNPGGQWSVLSLGASRATDTGTTTSGTTTTAVALKLSSTAIGADLGEEISVMASGGTPPYSFLSTHSSLALSFKSGSTARFIPYGVGKVDIVVSDAAGNSATCTVTAKSGLTMGIADGSTLSAVAGEQLTVHFTNGVPPYTVGTSNSAIAKAGEVTMHSGLMGSVTIYTFRAGTATIMVHDDLGNLKSVGLTVTSTR